MVRACRQTLFSVLNALLYCTKYLKVVPCFGSVACCFVTEYEHSSKQKNRIVQHISLRAYHRSVCDAVPRSVRRHYRDIFPSFGLQEDGSKDPLGEGAAVIFPTTPSTSAARKVKAAPFLPHFPGSRRPEGGLKDPPRVGGNRDLPNGTIHKIYGRIRVSGTESEGAPRHHGATRPVR